MTGTEYFSIDFIGIGAPRAGTTWIYECLKEHPQVCVSSKKETAFFLKNIDEYKKGLEYYKKYFKHCKGNQIIGEYDPWYLYSHHAAERIKEINSNVKLIVCVRNPVERAYSHFLRQQRMGIGKYSSFKEAIMDLNSVYISAGFYGKSLEYYHSIFEKEQVLILLYDDMIKNPADFIRNVFRFLNVDLNFIPEIVDKKVNPIEDNWAYFPYLNKILRRPSIVFKTNKVLRHLIPVVRVFDSPKLRAFLRELNTRNPVTQRDRNSKSLKSKFSKLKRYQKPQMDDDARKILREIFDSDIKKLEKLIGRSLSFWQ